MPDVSHLISDGTRFTYRCIQMHARCVLCMQCLDVKTAHLWFATCAARTESNLKSSKYSMTENENDTTLNTAIVYALVVLCVCIWNYFSPKRGLLNPTFILKKLIIWGISPWVLSFFLDFHLVSLTFVLMTDPSFLPQLQFMCCSLTSFNFLFFPPSYFFLFFFALSLYFLHRGGIWEQCSGCL